MRIGDLSASNTPAATHIFGRVLDQTTSSYKFFWLQALLSAIQNRTELNLPIPDLLDEMVIAAWQPVALYRLSLGQADMLQHAVSRLLSVTGLRPSTTSSAIRNALAGTNPAAELGRYVPFRFIAPWFEPELRGTDDYQRNRRIHELAAQRFGGPHSPPYCFQISLGVQQIRFNPGWHGWMRENFALIRAFSIRD